ncbi:MAG: hypothetical protein K2N84_07790 [Clostridia bacterium]|nr:hypothetical protein [Clostridia bacterium]
MKKKKTAIIALAVAATLACGTLAGCDLVTTDSHKDYAQTIATVDITKSEIFETGEFKDYKDVIQPASIIKRDMIASFVSSGYSAMGSYGWTYKDTFKAISESLVNRQLTIQYAMAFILKYAPDGRTVAGYQAAVAGKTDFDEKLAGLAYFLDEDEVKQALYKTRVLFNNTLDSQEKSIIDADGDDSSSTTVRTLPSGVNASNSDYYDEAYKIYTAVGDASKGGVASSCGTYETVEDSSPYTRKKAYNKFLASLRQNDLLFSDEDTTDFEGLTYFKIELVSAYERAIINKLSDLYERIAAASLSAEYLSEKYETLRADQIDAFNAEGGRATFEGKLDSVSDTSFLLAAPQTTGEHKYGYVINILLPFSKTQTAKLNAFNADYGDTNGNSFAQRAKLLKDVRATDQRASWFTGETDHGFKYDGVINDAYTGGNASRTYLFFEDNLTGNAKYEPMTKYYGKYTYNGTVTENDDGDYIIKPNKIDIDEFMTEMEGYLNAAFGKTVATGTKVENYYDRNIAAYYKDSNIAEGKVDYSSFVYYEGKVDIADYDVDKIFVSGTDENKAFSIVNELSFAYNTDTAGLNPYYGYSVVTGKTSFVSEFEYAAQKACSQGAGSYVVAPSDYGWHIIYCTFVFDKDTPFMFKADEMTTEGTFSYNFYEAMKSSVVETYSSNQQAEILSAYSNSTCTTVYEDRYSDLFELDNL